MDDVQQPQQVRSLVASIESTREAKIRKTLRELDSSASTIIFEGLTSMEINKMRPYILYALNRFGDLRLASNISRERLELESAQTGGMYSQTSSYVSDSLGSSLPPLRTYR